MSTNKRRAFVWPVRFLLSAAILVLLRGMPGGGVAREHSIDPRGGATFAGASPVDSAQRARKKSSAKKPPPKKPVVRQKTQRNAARAKSPEPRTLAELQKKIRSILLSKEFESARWGAKVLALDSGKSVFDLDAGKLFLPASNQKLYTTAAALDRFGPDFRMRTSVYAPRDAAEDSAESAANASVVRALILYGRGDPNLSNRAGSDRLIETFDSLATQIYQRGIREVSGDIVADETYFRSYHLGYGWAWNDLQWHYGAEISPLSVDDNTIEMRISPGAAIGEPCALSISPAAASVKIVNRTQTVERNAKPLGIHRGLESNVFEVWGEMGIADAPAVRELALHQPALLAADLLRDALVRKGIRVRGTTRVVESSDRDGAKLDLSGLAEAASLDSAPLGEEIKIVNKESQNLHAEILLRVLGTEHGPADQPSDVAGIALVGEFLKKAGVDPADLSIQDGSGLSRLDLVTPGATARLLAFMARHKYARVFEDSLPVAAQDGTLHRRMSGSAAAGNLRAKTGTLRYAHSLGGYVSTARGDRLAFCFVISNFIGDPAAATKAMDAAAALLAAYRGRL